MAYPFDCWFVKTITFSPAEPTNVWPPVKSRSQKLCPTVQLVEFIIDVGIINILRLMLQKIITIYSGRNSSMLFCDCVHHSIGRGLKWSRQLRPLKQATIKSLSNVGIKRNRKRGERRDVRTGWHSSPLPSFLAYPFPLRRVPHSRFPLPSSNRSWPRERRTLLAKGLGFYLRTCPHLSALNWFLMYSFG
jgi:hypothetical protein